MKKLVVFFATLVLLGSILWLGWLLGFLNHGLAGYTRMSISELEVIGQPYTVIFNALEDISGLLLIIGAVGLIAVSNLKFNTALLILMSIVAIGGLTLYDVAHPLDCNRYLSPSCELKISSNNISRTDQLHNDESRITCYISLILAVLIVVWATTKNFSSNLVTSLVVLFFGILVTLAILDTNSNITTYAVAERLWNLFVSLDIAVVALYFMQPKLVKRSR